MNKILVLPLIFLSISTSAQEAKQDTMKNSELKEFTIVGDRGKTMPGAGQYIGGLKLEKLNQSNVNNVLRIVPGVNVRDEEGFGLRPNIGLRGTSVNRSSKITLMEDGILIAPAPYSDPSAYYFPTFARMHGIEVLKGSSQIKYGPYTIGGAVNLLSTGIPKAFKGFAQLSFGSFNTNQQRVWVGDSRKNFDYVFEVNRLASNGFKEIDQGGNSGFDRRDILGKLRWHTAENAAIPQAITLKFVNTTEKGNETYLGLTYDDYQKNSLRRYAGTQKDILDINHQHISLNHTIAPSKQFSISTTAYYSKTFRDWARANTFGAQSINNILNDPTTYQTGYNIMTGQENGDIQYRSAARTFFSKGIQLNANYFFKTREITHKFQFGMRYHADEADRYGANSVYTMTNGRMIITTAGINGNQENQIRSAQSLATYLSYDIRYKGLKISPGIRHEKINFNFKNFGNADYERLGTALQTATNDLSIFLPGIGFNYEVSKIMSVFGGVHKGFSPPGMPSINASLGQAKVETSVNYELGYRYEKKNLNLQATTFLNNYANILGSDNVSGGGAGTGDMFNAGNAIIKGLEISLSYDVLNIKATPSKIKLPLTIAYTYTSAKFQETFVNGGGDWGSGTINKGDLIPFITPHLLTASLGFEKNKFDITLTGRYNGETRIKPGQGDVIVPDQNVSLADINSLEGFLIFDLSANYNFSKHITVFTLINNLTNSKAIITNLPQGYRPNIPLSFNIGVKANF
ncbi:MAG TPA: TonB-dependent receptor [Chitinophagaceae bacterium]|nr:TonB-dependent receptor [Chitinophagaceae bacterium]